MKGVKEAIKLDSTGRTREAYLQYLSCIQYISSALLEDANLKASIGGAMQSTPAQKMLRLVQQCTERSAALFESIDESQTPVSLPQSLPPVGAISPTTQQQTAISGVTSPPLANSTSSPSQPQVDNAVPTATQHTTTPHAPVLATSVVPPDQPTTMFPPSSPLETSSSLSSKAAAAVSSSNPCYEFPPVPQTSPVRMPQDGGTSSPVRIPSGGGSYQRTLTSPASHTSGCTSPVRKNQGSPLEVAYRENKKLMAAYRARLARMHSKKNRAAMSLTLQRRLMENMAIAKARESALAKKIQERQQRLQEEAASRFSTGGEPTVQELELRKLYASTLEFENQVIWLQEWRIKLKESPQDLQLINKLITLILSCKEHPLTQQLQTYQFTVYKLIDPLIQKDSDKIHQNCVPYHNVEPLELSAGAEPRVIPTDGFMTPEDPSKTIDEDLIKRLQALRESGSQYVRSTSAQSYASSTESAENEENLDELLSDDVWVDDVIFEEEENGRKECCLGELETGCTKETEVVDDGTSETIRDSSSPLDTCNAQNIESENSTDRTCQDQNNDCIDETKSLCEDIDKGEIDNVVDSMRAEVKEALDEGELLQHELEDQIKTDIAIGQGNDRLVELKQEVDADIDRRSSADSGVQEDRTDGDESSETHSAVSPVSEAKPEVSSPIVNEIDGGCEEEGDANKEGEDTVNVDSTEGEDAVNVDSTEGEDTVNVDSTEGEDTIDVDAAERTVKYSSLENNDGTRTLDQNANESEAVATDSSCDDDETKEFSEDKTNEECEKPERTVEMELTDGESKGDIDGGLDETEEERIGRLQEEALARHLQTISKDVLTYMDKVVSMLVAVYDELDNAVAREQCISVIEEHFFKIIWQPLLTLFRRVNVRKEVIAATSMTKYQNAAPEHIGVTKKLCLMQQEGGIQDGDDDNYPYWQAVQELRKMAQYYSPLEKLECIVRSSRIVIQCVGDYYEKQGTPRQNLETAIGCDDLLPILSYVIIKSAMPQIVSECCAMEEFIHEGYLFGEEGYCLTTLQTALCYVLKLAKD